MWNAYKGIIKAIAIRKLLGMQYLLYGAAYAESDTAKCFLEIS